MKKKIPDHEPSPDDDVETLAAYFEAHKDDDSMWDWSKPKKIRIRRGSPSHVFSVRFSPEELERIDEAAEAQGITMTELIRSAAIAAADSGQIGALKEIEEKARELTEAVSKLRAS
jgi:hypothetical protein